MRMRVMFWVMLLFAAAALLGACPRQYAAGEAPPSGTATHPWELQGYQPPFKAPEAQHEATTAVELPPDLGPQFPPGDTLTESKLSGIWLQTCSVVSERMNLNAPDDMDELELLEGGKAQYRMVNENVMTPYEGTWAKSRPGRLRLSLSNGEDVEYYALLFRDEFLYLWDQGALKANWFARVPLGFSERVMANRFDTQLGALKLTSVVNNSLQGEVDAGGTKLDIGGFYQSGVLSLRWEDPQHKAQGFAMFHVDRDWNTLYGALWLGDYEASPFLGPWDGVKAGDAAAP